MPPLTVVHVIDDLGLGGAQRQLAELTKAMPRHRYALRVVALSTEKRAYEGTIRSCDVPVTLIPQSGKWSWATLRTLVGLLQAERPVIVQTWLFTADLYGRLAACLSGRGRSRPVLISTVRSIDLWKPGHYVAVDRVLRRVTDAFSVNARAIGEVLQQRERIEPGKVRTIYNGVDLTAFAADLQDGLVRQRLGLTAATPLVGIIGRLVPEKDHQTFLEAARRVASACAQAEFLVLGDGPLRPELEALAHRLGLASKVHFLGSERQVAQVFAALDVVVVSSRYEGCCNVILEAMAMAKPVVATAVGGNPELVVPGDTGLLTRAQDPDGLAQAITSLLSRPDVARRMGRQARARAEAQFSVERMVQDTVEFYDGLLKAKGVIP